MRIECTSVGSLGSGVFELSRGLNAVVGPNGSGKSTLVNALYFAFTGETINGENIDSLISWGSPSCEIKVFGDGYTITRTVSKTGATKIRFVRGAVTLTRKKEVDQAICEMFGFVDLSVLKLVYFAEQYRSIDFITVTDSVRVQMLSALFGFLRLEKVRSDIQKVISSLDVSMVSDAVLAQMSSALNQAVQNRDSIISRQAEMSKLILSDDVVKSLEDVISSPVVGTRGALEESRGQKMSELSVAELELSEIPAPPDPGDVTRYNNAIRRGELCNKLKTASDRVLSIKDSIGLSPEDISTYLSKSEAIKATLLHKKSELEQQLGLLQSGKCPLTGGAPCPDLLAMANEDAVNSRIDEINMQLAQVDSDQTEMRVAYTEAKKLADELSAANSVVSTLSAELRDIPEDPDFDVKAFEKTMEVSGSDANRRSQLLISISSAKLAIESIEAELRLLEDKNEVSDEDQQVARQRLSESAQARASVAELSTLLPDAEKAAADQVDAVQFATEQNARAMSNKTKADTLSLIRQALHRDNLPKLLVEDMLTAVNSKLEFYLTKFNFPYQVTWTSEGSILYTDGIEWHRASQLSGGQKYVVVISLRCALADMLCSSFPVFVMDEPTTGLDVDNREALSKVLLSMVEQLPGNYLVVPTHDDMLLPDANIISVG